MANFFNIAYLNKVSLANLNSGEGAGGNITPIKKINDFEGNSYSYISGQAIRRYMKDTLQQLGQEISSVDESGNPYFLPSDQDESIKKRFDLMLKGGKEKGDKAELMKKVYQKYIDLDIFGYMFPKGERRRSPIKVSPMIATGILKGDSDFLTRKRLEKEDGKKDANIVQTELETMNFYRGNIMIKTDDIGVEVNEYTYKRTALLAEDEKQARLKKIIDMIKSLNGGSKTARMLEDISPKFVICVTQETGNPLFLNLLHVDEQKNIVVDPIIATIQDYKIDPKTVFVGLTSGIFANEQQVKNSFATMGIIVTGVSTALDSLVS